MKKFSLKTWLIIINLFVSFVLNAQVTALNGFTLPGGTTKICQQAGNTIPLRLVFSDPQTAPFMVYISDVDGTWTNERLVFTSASSGITSPATFNVSLPTTNFGTTVPLYGTNYRFRVKCGASLPSQTSPFEGSYRPFYGSIKINNNTNTLYLCGTAVTVNIDNVIGGPLGVTPTIPTTKYLWYKRPSTTSIGSGTSLSITTPGTYYVKIDYGGCSDAAEVNGFSPDLTVIQSSSVSLTVSSSNGNTICNGSSTILSSSITSAASYQWLDSSNNPISGATGSTYSASTSGTYKVRIVAGTCTVESIPYALTVQNTTLTTTPPAGTSFIIPGQPVNIVASVSNNQSLTTWSWSPTTNPTNTFTATVSGNYTVRAIQTSVPCPIDKSVTVTLSYPLSYNLNIAANNNTACVSQTATISVNSFNAVVTGNVNIPIPASVNGIRYKWFLNGVENTNVTSTQNVSVSGTYKLEITLENGTVVNSNNLIVGLQSNDVFAITPTGGLCNTTSQVQLAASVTNGQALNNYIYAWAKDGTVLPLTTPTITVTEAGTYKLTATNQFGCQFLTQYVLNPTLISDITFDKPSSVYLPAGSTLVINSTGGSTYSWTQNSNFLSTTSNSGPITQAGIVKATVTKGLCTFVFEFDVKSGNLGGNPDAVPNLVTPNNDTFNDTWVLPTNLITNNTTIAVEIYDNLGKVIFQTDNYLNNWPTPEIVSYNTNSVFYYILTPSNQEVQKGTITLLK
jgi:large repetitive protein